MAKDWVPGSAFFATRGASISIMVTVGLSSFLSVILYIDCDCSFRIYTHSLYDFDINRHERQILSFFAFAYANCDYNTQPCFLQAGERNIDIILFIIRACSRACFSRKFACCGKKRASNARNSDKKTANRHLPFCGVQ